VQERFEGTVTRIDPGTSWVDAGAGGTFRCDLRAKISRKENARLAVGDRVILVSEKVPDPAPAVRAGVIEKILERRTVLRRPRSYKRDQFLCANVDQVLLVVSAYDPPYKRNFIDRVLVAIERESLEPVIVWNKLDLADESYREVVEDDARVYVKLGYKVVGSSAVTGEGIEDLRALLRGRISATTGPSGVGKSTLLNAALPGLALKTAGVQEGTGRGKHTTTSAELLPIEGGGFVADTPGLRAFALWDVAARDLPNYYRELAKLGASCRFNDCSHREEPGCVVIPAVESGEVDEERYDSYKKLRAELESEESARNALKKR
jgi:ribosome biogenesis GTPase